jgi:hypothetical protein
MFTLSSKREFFTHLLAARLMSETSDYTNSYFVCQVEVKELVDVFDVGS